MSDKKCHGAVTKNCNFGAPIPRCTPRFKVVHEILNEEISKVRPFADGPSPSGTNLVISPTAWER